jgi:predicted TIM-barrel fold metal-dependent hydrolase
VIDIHTHLHPPRLFAAIRRWFAEKSDWKLRYPTEPQEVCRILREHGVERFAFCSYAHKPAMAKAINEWLVQTSIELDKVGLPLATVHPLDADVEEYALNAFCNGCIGLKIHEDVQQFGIDDPRLEKIYEIVSDHSGFVLAHVGPIPWDNTPKQAPVRVSGVLNQFPKVNFVLAHLGAPDTYEYLDLMEEFPNLFLDTTMGFAFQSKMPRPIEPEIFSTYSERIIFGSDFPNVPYEYDFEVKEIERFQLSEEILHRVFHTNAAKLMHI